MNDTELEGRLAAMLERRAAEITTVRPIRFGPPAEVRTRPNLAPYAVAAAVAAVLIAVAGTVVGIRTVHHDPAPPAGKQHTTAAPGPTPTPTASRACIVSMPQSWQRAITAGTISLDHPINNVISTDASTGEYLVDQVRPAAGGGSAQVTLAIFHGKTGQDLAEPPGERVIQRIADGSAAITADWIVYGLHDPAGNSGYRKAMLYNRHTGQSIVLEDLDSIGSGHNGELSGGPVLFDGKAYWVQGATGGQGGVVQSYDLTSGARNSTPVAAAVGLVYYGTGIAVVTGSDQGSALVNYTGAALAPAALRAAVGGAYFSYDGSTLRWWNYTSVPDSSGSAPLAGILYANRPGNAQVTQQRVDMGSNMTGVSTWPLVEVATSDTSSAIFDLRSNTLLAVPKGLSVQAVIGDQVLFGTGLTSLGNGGLSLVSLKDLPPVHC
jgi:hypothetical protein